MQERLTVPTSEPCLQVEVMVERYMPPWKGLLLVFLPALVVFVVLDGVFIALVAGPMFKAALQDMLRPSPDLVSGVLAWLCIVGMVYVFALPRAKNGAAAFVQGTLAGLCLYGTYELTNMSIITAWQWSIVVVDMAWGSLACGMSCATMFLLWNKLAEIRMAP